jgi:hypothetical protein
MMKLTCKHGARPIDLDSVVEVIWAATDLVFSQAAYQNVSADAPRSVSWSFLLRSVGFLQRDELIASSKGIVD